MTVLNSAIRAIRAGKGFFPGVSVVVSQEVALVVKYFAAEGTSSTCSPYS